jgi:hypothetical protein
MPLRGLSVWPDTTVFIIKPLGNGGDCQNARRSGGARPKGFRMDRVRIVSVAAAAARKRGVPHGSGADAMSGRPDADAWLDF